ncbi:MAG TPA: iron chelate uptake ABC transporter family permease subunit [Ilumatobacter sp.]|nr:iron chelate uptake ABC transporter family permease subunit [Ilumatobacter sp.]
MSAVVVRSGPLSVRINPRAVVVCLLLLLATLAVGVWSIMVGDFPLSARQVLRAVFGDGGKDAEFIVDQLRLPRTLTAMLVGAALGMSGAVFQSIARNPLGSPDIIGFESGAALGAVIVITMMHGSSTEVALGAVAGGLGTALLVYVLAYQRGLAASRLVLVGIGIGFASSAAVDYLITRAQIYDVQRAAVWLTGSLNGRTWSHVHTIGLALAVLAPAILLAQRALDRLELGDDTAAALGVRVGRTKLALLLLAVGLAALAVAAAGPIVFVAFVSGPIARRLVSSPSACVLPAACVGAFVTTVSDLAARRVLAPTELPVGIATCVIGAPYLLWLLARRARTGAL